MKRVLFVIIFLCASPAFSKIKCTQVVPGKASLSNKRKLVEIRSFVTKTRDYLEKNLQEYFKYLDVTPQHAAYLNPLKNIFECRICRLVSQSLRAEIEQAYPQYRVDLVMTKEPIFNTKKRHVYLVIKDFYTNPDLTHRDLYIDGTIRQYFHKNTTPPSIFVGTKPQLLGLFYDLYTHGEPIDLSYFDTVETLRIFKRLR